jgi:hypothetical protein
VTVVVETERFENLSCGGTLVDAEALDRSH